MGSGPLGGRLSPQECTPRMRVPAEPGLALPPSPHP